MLLVMFGVTVIVFFIVHVIPADPVGALLGGNAPPDLVDQMRHQLGYDRPLVDQFGNYILNLLHGNLGTSLKSNRPVIEDIAEYFPATLELSIVAIIIAVVLGMMLGILSAVYRNSWIDHFSRVFSILGVSMPVFWTGLILLLIFYYILGWLPGTGQLNLFVTPPYRITGMILLDSILEGNWAALWDGFRHIILPATVLGYSAAASIARITRASMLDVLKQDYSGLQRQRDCPKE